MRKRLFAVLVLALTLVACESPTDSAAGGTAVALTAEQLQAVIVATEAGRYATPHDDAAFQDAIDGALIVLRAARNSI